MAEMMAVLAQLLPGKLELNAKKLENVKHVGFKAETVGERKILAEFFCGLESLGSRLISPGEPTLTSI
jgi:hypothetical protein